MADLLDSLEQSSHALAVINSTGNTSATTTQHHIQQLLQQNAVKIRGHLDELNRHIYRLMDELYLSKQQNNGQKQQSDHQHANLQLQTQRYKALQQQHQQLITQLHQPQTVYHTDNLILEDQDLQRENQQLHVLLQKRGEAYEAAMDNYNALALSYNELKQEVAATSRMMAEQKREHEALQEFKSIMSTSAIGVQQTIDHFQQQVSNHLAKQQRQDQNFEQLQQRNAQQHQLIQKLKADATTHHQELYNEKKIVLELRQSDKSLRAELQKHQQVAAEWATRNAQQRQHSAMLIGIIHEIERKLEQTHQQWQQLQQNSAYDPNSMLDASTQQMLQQHVALSAQQHEAVQQMLTNRSGQHKQEVEQAVQLADSEAVNIDVHRDASVSSVAMATDDKPPINTQSAPKLTVQVVTTSDDVSMSFAAVAVTPAANNPPAASELPTALCKQCDQPLRLSDSISLPCCGEVVHNECVAVRAKRYGACAFCFNKLKVVDAQQ